MIFIPFVLYGIILAAASAGIALLRNAFLRFGTAFPEKAAGIIRESAGKLVRKADPGKGERRRREEKEIEEGISFLRNILAVGVGKDLRTDRILENLARREGLLQSRYLDLLSMVRISRPEEGVRRFVRKLQSAAAPEYARLLVQWDRMAPEQLEEVLLSMQKSVREARFTARKKREEVISDLIYLPAVFHVILIFVNFLYVSYFLRQQELLTQFF